MAVYLDHSCFDSQQQQHHRLSLLRSNLLCQHQHTRADRGDGHPDPAQDASPASKFDRGATIRHVASQELTRPFQ